MTNKFVLNGKVITLNNKMLSKPYAEEDVYEVRDIGPAGGLIFYVNPNYIADGWHYLEAAPSTGDSLTYRWSSVSGTSVGTTQTSIGTGLSNTTSIVAQSSNSAAGVCSSYVINSYDDWFLPSLDELNLMYTNLHLHSVGNFTASSYWTSSEISATNSYRQTFNGGAQSSQTKTTYYRIRAARRFSTVSKYTVSYNGNGYTSGTVPTDSTIYKHGTSVTVQSPSSLFHNTDAFVCWNTLADGNGIDYTTGMTFNITSNMTFYAKWAVYTVAFLPDTQSYVIYKPAAMTSQIDWLINNKEKLNLKFVGHEGDIVQSFDTDITEWEFARTQMNKLISSGIPYSTLPGNHDYAELTRDSTVLNNYFPLSAFTSMSTYGGSYDTNSDNTYHIVDINGNDLLILSLEFGPRDEIVTWANSVLTTYSGTTALVLVHSYLRYDGELLAPGDNHAPSNGYGLGTDVNDGTDLWTNLIYPNNNISFVICGHDGRSDDGASMRISSHADDSPIYQVMANYQYYANFPGYLLLLSFNSNTVSLRTYSPYIDEYKTDAESQADWTWSF